MNVCHALPVTLNHVLRDLVNVLRRRRQRRVGEQRRTHEAKGLACHPATPQGQTRRQLLVCLDLRAQVRAHPVPLLEGPHVLDPLEQAVHLRDADQHVTQHAARNKRLDGSLRERRGPRARIQVIVRARERVTSRQQIKTAMLAPHFQLLVELEAPRRHARMLHVGLERGSLLTVLRQARHKRERRIGENTKDFGVVGGDGIKLVCHGSSIVPDKPRGPPLGPFSSRLTAAPVTSPSPANCSHTITLKDDHRTTGRIFE